MLNGDLNWLKIVVPLFGASYAKQFYTNFLTLYFSIFSV